MVLCARAIACIKARLLRSLEYPSGLLLGANEYVVVPWTAPIATHHCAKPGSPPRMVEVAQPPWVQMYFDATSSEMKYAT